MSIYIEGLNLPKKGEGYLIAINSDGVVRDWRSYELTGCKAIELHPHGRLGDLDVLRRAMYHEAFETDSPMQKWDSGCWIRYKLFERMEEAAPTIIPASGGNENE